MTNHIVTTAITQTADNAAGYTLTNGEDLYVTGSGSINALGAGAQAIGLLLDATATSSEVTILGSVYSASSTGIYGIADFEKVSVIGEVLGSTNGIQMLGQSADVIVAQGGLVEGATGVMLAGSFGNVQNAGTIIGGLVGVSMSAMTGRLYNSGVIHADVYAVQVNSSDEGIVNSGTIEGDLQDNTGGGVSINNSGRWMGSLAIDAGSDVILNSGVIAGSLSLGGGVDVVRNQGTISDHILMGDDGDLLDTRQGHISLGFVYAGSTIYGAYGGNGDDTLYGGSDGDWLSGDAGNDKIIGLGGDDVFSGGDGLDSLKGGGGDDSLDGGLLADQLNGGAGEDTLIGGRGADTLRGGLGVDSFIFTSGADSTNQQSDLIMGLESTDVIDVSGIDAKTTVAGDQAFTLVSSFSHVAGQLAISYSAGKGLTLIQGDVDGDGSADFTITASGDVHSFTGFVL